MSIDRRTLIQIATGGAAALTLPGRAKAQAEALAAPASNAPMLHLPARNRVSLDGPWRYIIDPYDAGARGNNVRRTFWKDDREGRDIALVEYDWATSPTIDLPRDWNSHAAELLWYDGPVYFQRRFDAPALPGRRRFLSFEAVNYIATVWLNGVEIGRHEGGFTPFAFDVTDKLLVGTNRITVRADSRHGPEAVPTKYTDWQNYGGITRSVWLVDVPAAHIADWFVRIERGRIIADVTVSGAASGTPVTVSIGETVLRGRTGTDGVARLEHRLPRALALWTPTRPVLHPTSVSAAGDTLTDRIGLRTIETRGRELLLNGKPIYLCGISLHEEPIGAVGTRRMTEADVRKLLGEAKSLGCNFVRLAHYPHGETTLRIADELGLIVWAEVPVYWEDIAYNSPNTLALAKAMLGNMILRDRNRASIGLWSVANETPITPARNAFLRAMIAHARELDPTRLITAALNKNVDVGGAVDGQSRFVVEDELGRDLDILAVNQYEAWYSKRTPAELSQVSFATAYDKPLMFSEFGADALHGHRGTRDMRWTEEYQAWLFEETIKLVERTPGCIGMSPWLLKDFRSPRRWHGKFQQYWNRKGLISEDGKRKLAFDVLRRFYRSKAES